MEEQEMKKLAEAKRREKEEAKLARYVSQLKFLFVFKVVDAFYQYLIL